MYIPSTHLFAVVIVVVITATVKKAMRIILQTDAKTVVVVSQIAQYSFETSLHHSICHLIHSLC